MTEADIQKQIITWCGYALKSNVVYWSTPNEREPKRMGALRAMGLKTGVSDLIFLRDGQAIFVEVKRPTTYKWNDKRTKKIIDQRGGTLSTAQEEFKNAVTAAGFTFYCVDNLPDFQNIMGRWGWVK